METGAESRRERRIKIAKWAVIVSSAAAIALTPVPAGVTPQSWRLLAIFVATIIGSILRPVPSAAVVLLGVTAVALVGVLPVGEALRGYADPVVWLVLAAFFISRGMIKTPLGRRTLGRRHLPRRQEPRRSLRLQAGRVGRPPRRLPLRDALPVRSGHLR